MLAILGVEITAPLDLNVWQNTPFRDMTHELDITGLRPRESKNAASGALLYYHYDLQISRLPE